MSEELDILHKRRIDLIEYVITKDLMKEIHYMKFLELQNVNFEIIKIEPNYDYSNTKGEYPILKGGK